MREPKLRISVQVDGRCTRYRVEERRWMLWLPVDTSFYRTTFSDYYITDDVGKAMRFMEMVRKYRIQKRVPKSTWRPLAISCQPGANRQENVEKGQENE